MVWKQYLARELWIHAMFDVACPVVSSGMFADDSDALAEQTATPNGVLLRWFSGVREVVQYRSAANSFSPQRQHTLFPRHRNRWNERNRSVLKVWLNHWDEKLSSRSRCYWRTVRHRTPIFRQIRLWRASMWADQVRFSWTVTPRSTALIGESFKYIKDLGALVEKEPSEIHRIMTGLPPKIVWTMSYCLRPSGGDIPVPVRSPKSSTVERGEYLDWWPPGNTPCCIQHLVH